MPESAVIIKEEQEEPAPMPEGAVIVKEEEPAREVRYTATSSLRLGGSSWRLTAAEL